MIITKGPFSLSLFGGSSDHKEFYEEHGSFLKTMNQTLTDIFITQASDPSSKNYSLYLKSLEVGNSISSITKPGEGILLAKKSGEDLFSCFMGSILYGRLPLIIQRPSPKVHQSFFEKRMVDLKNQIPFKLCICESVDKEKYSPFFDCYTSFPAKNFRHPVVHPHKKDLAFVQLSSGTTGSSKICKISHEQIVEHCRDYGKVIEMDSSKCVVSWLPLYHDMGLIAAFLLPLIHDSEFHIIDPFDWIVNPKSLLELIYEHKGTHCWMPSFAFNYMANKIPIETVKKLDISSLEHLISCSEPTFYNDLEKFGETFSAIGFNNASLSVCYALAENIFAVSQSKELKQTEWRKRKYTSCGTILNKVSVRIVKDGKESKEGTVMIKSPYEPRTNVRSSFENYYDTGDIGFIKNNELYIIGREKDMFVSYGVNIYPEAIEHLISNIEGVVPGRVVCFGCFSKEVGTNRVIICVETLDVKNNKLKVELSSIIKEEFNLTSIVILVAPGSLIKTSSGKFCRIKNKENYEKNHV